MFELVVAVLYLGIIILNGRIARNRNVSSSGTIFASFFLSYWVTIYLLTFTEYKTGDVHSESKDKATSVGSVYVLKNSTLPDVVKIGYTTRSAEVRARELSGTGVPGKWQVAHEIPTTRPKQVEKAVHQKLSRQKVQDGGEFFKISPKKAARVIKKVAG